MGRMYENENESRQHWKVHIRDHTVEQLPNISILTVYTEVGGGRTLLLVSL